MDAISTPPIDALAALLDYPDTDFAKTVRKCEAALRPQSPAAARELERFAAAIEGLSTQELQELYVNTFDFDPRCTLDLGWHLHGEDYARGAFLASMRDKLQRAGIAEQHELPDHLPMLVRLVNRLSDADADELRTAIRPAVEQLGAALDARHSPYVHLIRSIATAAHLGGRHAGSD